jgi:dCMP deaminase
MELAEVVSKRSTCLRRSVGAILVRDKLILATGYNGAPSGLRHCSETGCVREQLRVPSGERQEICRALHAEQNVLVQAARHGISTKDATLYCTTEPCILCSKMLINAGIRRVVFKEEYPDALATQMLDEAAIEREKFGTGGGSDGTF